MKQLKTVLLLAFLFLNLGLSAAVDPASEATLAGMNRNILERQRSAFNRGAKEVSDSFKVVSEYCHDRDLLLF